MTTAPSSHSRGSGTPERATIEDVARLAGVSRAAVSKVIRNAYGVSDEMRDRVNAAIAQLKYRPRLAARSMRGSSHTIGVQIPRIDNTFFITILNGVIDRLSLTDYHLILAPMTHSRDGEAVLESLIDRQVDGIIAVAPAVRTEWMQTLGERIPLVQVGQHDQPRSYDVVCGDDESGARLAMTHLLASGHQRIANFTVDPDFLVDPVADPHVTRTRVYEQMMRAHGLEPDIRPIALTAREAYRATLSMLSEPDRPTALFAGHDMLALGALRASAEIGFGPHQFAVVGYDGVEMAEHPMVGLTTIDQDGAEMGGVAARLLLERIAGRAEGVVEQITPTLRVRKTSGVAPL